MLVFPGQSEITTNPGRDNAVKNIDGYKVKKSGNKPGQTISKICQTKNNRNHQKNDERHAFSQAIRPPLKVELLQFWAMGVIALVGGYLLYSFSLNYYPSLGNFLLYILNPTVAGGQINQGDNSPGFEILFLCWMGMAVIAVKGIYKALAQSIWVFLVVFSVVFLPVILLWCVWQYSFLFKFGWMVCYLSVLWFLFWFEL
ncbi:MAG: hypothetical protein K6U74_02290 [Firmicutes bacterium]|nr:hypothetical protein [Bacillota bacterium]